MKDIVKTKLLIFQLFGMNFLEARDTPRAIRTVNCSIKANNVDNQQSFKDIKFEYHLVKDIDSKNTLIQLKHLLSEYNSKHPSEYNNLVIELLNVAILFNISIPGINDINFQDIKSIRKFIFNFFYPNQVLSFSKIFNRMSDCIYNTQEFQSKKDIYLSSSGRKIELTLLIKDLLKNKRYQEINALFDINLEERINIHEIRNRLISEYIENAFQSSTVFASYKNISQEFEFLNSSIEGAMILLDESSKLGINNNLDYIRLFNLCLCLPKQMLNQAQRIIIFNKLEEILDKAKNNLELHLKSHQNIYIVEEYITLANLYIKLDKINSDESFKRENEKIMNNAVNVIEKISKSLISNPVLNLKSINEFLKTAFFCLSYYKFSTCPVDMISKIEQIKSIIDACFDKDLNLVKEENNIQDTQDIKKYNISNNSKYLLWKLIKLLDLYYFICDEFINIDQYDEANTVLGNVKNKLNILKKIVSNIENFPNRNMLYILCLDDRMVILEKKLEEKQNSIIINSNVDYSKDYQGFSDTDDENSDIRSDTSDTESYHNREEFRIIMPNIQQNEEVQRVENNETHQVIEEFRRLKEKEIIKLLSEEENNRSSIVDQQEQKFEEAVLDFSFKSKEIEENNKNQYKQMIYNLGSTVSRFREYVSNLLCMEENKRDLIINQIIQCKQKIYILKEDMFSLTKEIDGLSFEKNKVDLISDKILELKKKIFSLKKEIYKLKKSIIEKIHEEENRVIEFKTQAAMLKKETAKLKQYGENILHNKEHSIGLISDKIIESERLLYKLYQNIINLKEKTVSSLKYEENKIKLMLDQIFVYEEIVAKRVNSINMEELERKKRSEFLANIVEERRLKEDKIKKMKEQISKLKAIEKEFSLDGPLDLQRQSKENEEEFERKKRAEFFASVVEKRIVQQERDAKLQKAILDQGMKMQKRICDLNQKEQETRKNIENVFDVLIRCILKKRDSKVRQR